MRLQSHLQSPEKTKIRRVPPHCNAGIYLFVVSVANSMQPSRADHLRRAMWIDPRKSF
jgi:hypothetical protein